MHPLDDAFLRVDRAGEHLADLQAGIDAYLSAQKLPVVRVEGNVVQYSDLTTLPDPPRKLGVLLGESVQNLRTALDYLVFQLALMDSGFDDPKRKTQFPIESRPEGFESRRQSHLKGVNDTHATAIERLQPYNGGDWLALLAAISNLDKHNVLPLDVMHRGFSGTFTVGLSDEEAHAAGAFRVKGDEMGMYFPLALDISLAGQSQRIADVVELLKSQTTEVLNQFKPAFERDHGAHDASPDG